MRKIIVATIATAALIASCSGPTAWEEHGEAKWGHQTQLFTLTTNMDDVIEGYNTEYDLIDHYDAPEDCDFIEDRAEMNLTYVGQYATMDGAYNRKTQDETTGAVLADGEWMELNSCP